MKQFDSVERVGWELWVHGFSVVERFWREPLREAHQMFLVARSFALNDRSEDGGPELSDAADEFIETAGDLRDAPRRMGVARRRLGRDEFKELLGIVLSAVIGALKFSESAAGESADPSQILSRLLGTEPGRHKAAVPPSPFVSVTGRAVAENMEAMARFLPRIATSISAETISEADLVSARNELIFLMHSYLSVRQNEARIVPGSTPDLKLLRQLFGDLKQKEQAALLLIWLAVRDVPGWRENLEALRQRVLAELSKGNSGNGKPQPD